MTSRIWTTSELLETIEAVEAAGYTVWSTGGNRKVYDADTNEVFLIAVQKDTSSKTWLVRYDAKLFDESAEREYPNGM